MKARKLIDMNAQNKSDLQKQRQKIWKNTHFVIQLEMKARPQKRTGPTSLHIPKIILLAFSDNL